MDNAMAQQSAVALAVLQTEVAHLKAGMADLKATNAQQSAKLDEVLAAMNEARGGWKTLMLIGGAAGSIGSAITWISTNWRA